MTTKTKILSVILGLALVAVMVPAGASAAALTSAQVSAIVSLLQSFGADAATIANVQASLTGGTPTGGTPVPTGVVACAGVTFTRTLTVGSTGQDVKCLQVLMNTNGYTLAATGAGSPGMETSYFGPATLTAVRAFQTAKGWVPANQVGPMTIAALNALIAGSPTIPPVTPPAPTGQVGFIDAGTLAASPASNANITATSNVPVLGVNVKAINSDMTVNSLKVKLAVVKTSAEHPSTLVQKLYVYDGATLLGSYGVDTNSVYKSGTDYYVILSGFNFMVPANTTKALTINADFAPALESNRTLTISLFDTAAVGATDGTGATRSSGVATTRVFTVTYLTVGSSTLTVTDNSTTPDSTSVNVNHSDGTTEVPMLIFNTKSTVGASKITDIKFTAQGDNTAVAKVTAVKLYDGSTLLGSQSLSSAVSGATASFTDLSIAVAKDATKTLTVKADFGADVTGGDYVRLSVLNPSSDVTYEQPDLTTSNPTAVSAVAGNNMYLYDGVAAQLSFVSGVSTYSYNATTPSLSSTAGAITLKVKSDGGTTVKPVAADFTVLVYVNGDPQGAAVSKVITVTPDTTIADGSEATVVINVSQPRGTATVSGSYSGTGFVDFRVTNAKWVTSDGTLTSTVTAQTWGLDDMKTNASNVQ
jgi:hypothetical protein